MSSVRTTTMMMAAACLAAVAACKVDGPTGPSRSESHPSSANPIARGQGPGGGCLVVSGTIEEWDNNWPYAASGSVAGFFTGTGSAQMILADASHQGAPVFAGERTFTTGYGTLTMSGELLTRYQKIEFRKVTGEFEITGGTGGYENASGEIHITGRASFNPLDDFGAHLEYKGTLCGTQGL